MVALSPLVSPFPLASLPPSILGHLLADASAHELLSSEI